MTPLRVLHVDTGRTWRGGQAQVDLLVGGLATRGHTQLVAAPAGPLSQRLTSRGVEVVRFAPHGDLDGPAALLLAARARAFAPDLVHLHDARAHALGWFAARAAGAACVVSRRVAFGATVRLPHAFKYTRLPIDRYLALSGPVKTELLALGVADARIDIVPDAVDVAAVERAVAAARADGSAAARRASSGAGEGSFVAGTIAALTREKGQDVLVAAAGRSAARPYVILHGAGPEDGTLRAFATRAPRPVGVAFVADDDPFVTLAALDVLVVPSRAEGMGSIVLAAQAAGVPVIAAAIGGLPEIVRDGHTGWLVPPGDPEALAAALDRVHAEPAAARSRAEAARATVVAYDVAVIAARTEAAYSAACGERSSRGSRPR